jgi:protein transport protein SEC61 subunit gamma-like protein
MKIDVKEKLAEYRRVLQVARKPSEEEFRHLVKICGLGIILIGIIGFTTYALSVLFIG